MTTMLFIPTTASLPTKGPQQPSPSNPSPFSLFLYLKEQRRRNDKSCCRENTFVSKRKGSCSQQLVAPKMEKQSTLLCPGFSCADHYFPTDVRVVLFIAGASWTILVLCNITVLSLGLLLDSTALSHVLLKAQDVLPKDAALSHDFPSAHIKHSKCLTIIVYKFIPALSLFLL